MHKSLVRRVDPHHQKRLLRYAGFEIQETVGSLLKVRGFDRYNHLIDINRVFSTHPKYEPVDRMGLALGPIRYQPDRPWTPPATELSLDQALRSRVNELCSLQQMVNLFWSGGIDSTTILVAFIKHAPNLAQCRVIYSPWSCYEHPDFFKILQKIPDIQLLDMSGERYLELDLDGVFVTGNTGDEMHASLDHSFFTVHGADGLRSSWRDLFYSIIPNDEFMYFCEDFFARAGRPIQSILEARWWFYACAKLTSILNEFELNLLCAERQAFDPQRLIGFFNCECYERFIFFNIDRILETDSYSSWRQFLKDYCYQFDGLDDWRVNKSKFHSSQMRYYTMKKMILNDQRNLMILQDGEVVTTPNLPFFSQNEWMEIEPRYRHVFRQAHTV